MTSRLAKGPHRWGFKPLGSTLKMGGESIGPSCGALWSSELDIKVGEWNFFVWCGAWCYMELLCSRSNAIFELVA
jgi:hypothetical protein